MEHLDAKTGVKKGIPETRQVIFLTKLCTMTRRAAL